MEGYVGSRLSFDVSCPMRQPDAAEPTGALVGRFLLVTGIFSIRCEIKSNQIKSNQLTTRSLCLSQTVCHQQPLQPLFTW